MTPLAAAADPARMDVVLRTTDLAVGYRTRRSRRAVLERVNLTVHAGELVCLLGPNGIGKSTLLRTVARMQPPLWGEVELGGKSLRTITQSDLAKRLGVVLTARVAPEALPARRIVELARYPYSGWFGRVTAGEISDRINDWRESKVAIMSLACSATLDGAPLADATVVFEPEKFLGENIKPATGITGPQGTMRSDPADY